MPLAISSQSSYAGKVKSAKMVCAGASEQPACPRSAQFAAAELQRSLTYKNALCTPFDIHSLMNVKIILG